ncbi:MAG: hypothetical protein WBG70_07170 [Spirulinaceae cyanobacterium]
MGYSTSDFLPDFPVNESLQELRFHLRSLYYDLLSEIKSTKALSVFVPSNKSEYHRLRNESEDISTGAEHYVCYHLVKALKLADKELSLPSLTDIWSQITCQELEVADGDSPLSSEQITQYTLDFQKEVKEVLSQLCLSLNIVSRFVENERLVKETKHLETELIQLAEILAGKVLPLSEQLYQKAVLLYKSVAPEEVAEEEYWQNLAIPLYEETHPLARSLEHCPRCGAVLTGEDRTFVGSFCESCRTRWDEPSEVLDNSTSR